jgi:hypothetical protein
MARLRYVDGVTYGVRADVEQVAGDRRRLLVVVDGLPDRLPDVARGTVDVIEELARNGPTVEELRTFVEHYRRATSGEGAAVAELSRLADCVLTGRKIQSPQQLLAELETLTPERLREGLARAMGTALWCVPPGIEVPGAPDAPGSSDVEVRGLRFTPPVGLLQTSFVDVSDDGATVVFEGGERVAATVKWSQCVAALGYDDGSRVLIGRDGFRIALHPEWWARYEELRAYVDRRLPPGTWAPQGPAPERRQPQAPVLPKEPTSSGAWIALSVALWLMALLFGWAAVTDGVDVGVLTVAVVVAALGALPAVHVARRRQRQRAGLARPAVRRYRGVAVWPTWLVACGLIPSAALALVAVATMQPWPVIGGLGLALACAKELRRRRLRGTGRRRLSP